MNEIEQRFNAILEVEPDTVDLQTIGRITKVSDTSEGISLDDMDAIREA